MENNIEKSYNPFTMLGSWIGFIFGIIGSATSDIYLNSSDQSGASYDNFGDLLVMYNPLFWVAFPVLSKTGLMLVTIITTPILFFIYGWVVHSIFRKSNSLIRIIFASIVALCVVVSLVYSYSISYLTYLDNGSKSFNFLDTYIYSQMAKKIIEKSEVEKDNIYVISEMFKIAGHESIPVTIKVGALESLASRVNTMNSDEKNFFINDLDIFANYINKQNQLLDLTIESNVSIKDDNEKVMSEIIILKNLLNK